MTSDPLVVCYFDDPSGFALSLDTEALVSGKDIQPDSLKKLASRIESHEVNKVILTPKTCTGFRVRLRREVVFVFSGKHGDYINERELQAVERFVNTRVAVKMEGV